MSSSNSNTNIRIPGAPEPSDLLKATMSVRQQTEDGKISQSEARAQAQRLIQANKNAVNLAIIKQIPKI